MSTRSNEQTRLAEVEARLRAEAGQQMSEPPSHLQARIMAEVSSLHEEERGGWRWAGMAAGITAVLFLILLGSQHASTPTPGPAPVIGEAGVWPDVTREADSVSSSLYTVVARPFDGEATALASDTRRATRFLAACIPL